MAFEEYKKKIESEGVKVGYVVIYPKTAAFSGCVRDWKRFLPTLGFDDSVLADHANKYWQFSSTLFGFTKHLHMMFYHYMPLPSDVTNGEKFIRIFSPYEEVLKNKAWLAVLNRYTRHNFLGMFQEKFKSYAQELREFGSTS